MFTTDTANQLRPFIQKWIQEAVESAEASGGGGAPSPHALNSTHHTGTLADSQAPQFAKTDGSRVFTGNIQVSSGVTVDGVDISAFKALYDGHLSGDSHGVYALAEGYGTRAAAYANRLNRTVTAGTGLTGGGLLTFDRTLAVDFANAAPGAVGLSGAVGVVNQAAREDHTHALDVSISPTWTGTHTFSNRTTHNNGLALGYGDTIEFGSALANLYALGTDTDLLITDNNFKVAGLLGVGTDPTARLHVLGGASTTLVKLEGTTGNYLVVDADASNMVRFGTSDFASGLRGWRIDGDGTAEFNNVFVRGELHATIFVADEMHATGGTLLVKTASKVEAPKSVGDNLLPGSLGSAFTLVVQASYDTGFCYFADNDVLRIKTMLQVGGGLDLYDIYLEVDGTPSSNGDRDLANGNPGTHDVVCRWRQGGAAGLLIQAGTAVVKWGETGGAPGSYTGGVLLTSDLNQSPYIDVFTVSSNGTDAWTVAPTPRVRVGKLDGITDPDLNPSGFGIWTDNGFFDGKIVARTGQILDSVIIGGGSVTAQDVEGWGWGADSTYIDGNQLFTGTVNTDKLNVGIGGGNLIVGANWNDDPTGTALLMPGGWERGGYGTVTTHKLENDSTGTVTGVAGEHYITATVGASSGTYIRTSNNIYVDTGRSYTLSAYARRTSGSGSVSIGVECYDSGGSLLGYRFPALDHGTATGASGLVALQYRYSGTIAGTGSGQDNFYASTYYVKVFVWCAESTSGSTTANLWQVQFEEGDLLTQWAPGMRGNVQIDSQKIMVGTPGAQRTEMVSEGIRGYNSLNALQAIWDSTDGKIKAGGGKVEMSSEGFALRTTASDAAFFLFKDGTNATDIGTMYVYKRTSPSTKTMGFLGVTRTTGGTPAELYLQADSNSSTIALVLDGAANSGAGEVQVLGQFRVGSTQSAFITGGLNVGSATGAATGTVKASGDLVAAGRVSTDNGTTLYELGTYTLAGDAVSNGYVTITINGTAYKFMTRA